MTRRSRLRQPGAALAAFLLALTALVALTSVPAHAADPMTVSAAIGAQDGSSRSVRGYVVGQPTATATVVRSGFPNDYAMAIADTASETSTSRMLYVQIPSEHRADWGLRSNPDLVGRRVDVTGVLEAYFSHPGMRSTSAFALADGSPTEPPTDPDDPGDPGTPVDPGIPAGYYDPAQGLTGEPLKRALHDIIDGHTALSYSTVWDALKEVDEDPANPGNVLTVYSRRSLPKSSNGGDPDDWNREHTWAKSHGDFGTSAGPGTDVHHLMPEDVSVNSARGNLDFDNGGGSVYQCPDCAVDGDSFEPPDATKGDVARAMFYMAVRYEGDDGHADLELNDRVGNGSAPYIGRLSVLLEWHRLDPVSASEIRRNNLVYANWQHNRNPFVDHPEWVAAIWN